MPLALSSGPNVSLAQHLTICSTLLTNVSRIAESDYTKKPLTQSVSTAVLPARLAKFLPPTAQVV